MLHFLALAYGPVRLRVRNLLKRPMVGPDVMRLCRSGLAIFAAGSLVGALGEVTMTLAEISLR
jgi:hypothetical protein